MSKIRLHKRPSGTRHAAISGIHIIPELRHLLKPTDAGFDDGVACPECGAVAMVTCVDPQTQQRYPDDTVHLSRARSL